MAAVTIIGAGPYGLSLAAHLSAAGVDTRIYGRPMDSWLEHMPRGMLLKSDPFASNLSDAEDFFTLERFSAERWIGYDASSPVLLGTFCDYGLAFQKRFAPALIGSHVTALHRTDEGFTLQLDNGEESQAPRVVVAIGLGHFRYIPDRLSHLEKPYISHSFDHHDLSAFSGVRVAVVGGGASAIDLAGLLGDQGTEVSLVTRRSALKFSGAGRSSGDQRPFWSRFRHPSSGLGPGLRSRFSTDAPLLIHALPKRLRLEFARRHLGPAASGVMREKVLGRLPVLLDRKIAGAEIENGQVVLTLMRKDKGADVLRVDHVIAATGFCIDVSRLDFLPRSLQQDLEVFEGTPVLSSTFESSVPGLYFIGPAAAPSFGPLMRFAFGARYVARRLTRALAKQYAAERGHSASPPFRRAPRDGRLVPKVLVAGALVWPNVVRLCRAFREAGFETGAAAVAEHPVHRTSAPARTFVYRPKAPVESLRQAITPYRPDLIVPCDDRILGHLQSLWASAESDLSALIESSLGRAAAEGVVSQRGTLGELGRLPDVTVPQTDNVSSTAELRSWVRQYGLPAVLKLDGSWGGRDLVLLSDDGEISRAFVTMRLRSSRVMGVKRYMVNRDVEALSSRTSSAISVQTHIIGRPANIAIACWKGEVVGHVAVEVTRSAAPFSRATAVRVVDGEAMVAAARSGCAHTDCPACTDWISSLDETLTVHASSRSILGQPRLVICH